MENSLSQVIELRKSGNTQGAIEVINRLLQSRPLDPDINYQAAWTYDSMGKESTAVDFYETALENGLKVDREGAIIGLGSTYRCLGEYTKSLRVLDQGISEFPQNRAMKVFRSLTLYNLGIIEESMEQLLLQLVETTENPEIKSYGQALVFYSDKLSETWK